MKAPVVLCLSLLAAIALGVQATSPAAAKVRGVAKTRANLYVPNSAGEWKCLDGSKTIPFSAVNDDYCDCKDGSDEPGTSACPNGSFHCANSWHIPANIRSSRVNDGICDPDCCDGSDEFDGHVSCPNTCKQLGAKAREEKKRLKLVQAKGSELRKEYVAFGATVKATLFQEVNALKKKLSAIVQDTMTAQAAFDASDASSEETTEELSEEERMELRRQEIEPYTRTALERVERAKAIRESFKQSLENLRENHNQNFHDMVVKTSLAGYDEYIYVLEEEEKAKEANPWDTAAYGNEPDEWGPPDEYIEALTEQAAKIRTAAGTLFELLKEVKEGYNKDYNDRAVLQVVSDVDQFEQYWNGNRNEFKDEDPLVLPEVSENVKQRQGKPTAANTLLNTIRAGAGKIGLGKILDTRTDNERARDEIYRLNEEERNLRDSIQTVQEQLAFDFGPKDVYGKLLNQCFEHHETPDLSYKLCPFGKVTQSPPSGTELELGNFAGWEAASTTVAPYTVMLYTGGQRCYPGPERSARVEIRCGLVDELVAVTEPAKCVYIYQFLTPAACPVTVVETPEVSEEEEEAEADNEGVNTSGKRHDEL